MYQDDVKPLKTQNNPLFSYPASFNWLEVLNSSFFVNDEISIKMVRLNRIIRKERNSFFLANDVSYEFKKEINELKLFFAKKFEDLSSADKSVLKSIFLNSINVHNIYISDELLLAELYKHYYADDLIHILFSFVTCIEKEHRLYINFLKHVLLLKVNKTLFQIDFNYLIKLLIGQKCFHVFPDEDSLNYNISRY
ncbi:hypothetical protein Q2490_17070 [Myroides odoratimimus]|uniref:hypothetical protein n=1 Tax=Myroides odoratimimus TaxID=76832 RepID=UPI0026E0CFDC|nr:hypothetical protein [Myroides odoratimimus]MDO5858991.1 hypothetical protein [Myroides odoratimimus]